MVSGSELITSSTRLSNSTAMRVSIVPRADRAEVSAEIAHNALDDFGAQPIIAGQRVAFDRRQPFGGDGLRIGARADPVLHIALRQPPDGAGAEAQQDIAGIRGVALEI